jgi:hypothetical protein
VFVHGAFADASGFGESIKTLQKMGYTTYAPANPLCGLTGDTDYLRTFLGTLSGPIVLVGHYYGGTVITNAATGNPNIKALVYIAAYALDEGEAVADANGLGGGTSDLLANVDFRPYPGAPTLPNGQPDQDAYIKQASFQKSSRPTCPTPRRRSWPRPSGPPLSSHYSVRPVSQPGRPSRLGTSYPRTTRRSRRRPNGSGPPAPRPTPSRSPARTP